MIYVLAFSFIIGNSAVAMESFEKWITFKVSGFEITTTKQTIEESCIEYLINILKGRFAVDKDKDGRILIDRPQEEGEILDKFLRTKKLPRGSNLESAGNAADFFGIPAIKAEILKREKQREEKKRAKNREWIFDTASTGNNYCNLCKIYAKNGSMFVHLTTDHKAEIMFITSHNGYDEMYFKYPKPAQKLSKNQNS